MASTKATTSMNAELVTLDKSGDMNLELLTFLVTR